MASYHREWNLIQGKYGQPLVYIKPILHDTDYLILKSPSSSESSIYKTSMTRGKEKHIPNCRHGQGRDGERREWKEMLTSGLPVSVPDVRRSCHHRHQRQRQSHLRRPVLLLQLPHQSRHLFPQPSAVALSLSFLPDSLLARLRSPVTVLSLSLSLSLVQSAPETLKTLKLHCVRISLSLSLVDSALETLKTLKVHPVSVLSLSYTILKTLKVHSVRVLSLSYTTLKTLKVHSDSSLSLSYTPPWKP